MTILVASQLCKVVWKPLGLILLYENVCWYWNRIARVWSCSFWPVSCNPSWSTSWSRNNISSFFESTLPISALLLSFFISCHSSCGGIYTFSLSWRCEPKKWTNKHWINSVPSSVHIPFPTTLLIYLLLFSFLFISFHFIFVYTVFHFNCVDM